MGTWTAQIETEATPAQLLAVLTDPEAIQAWSPIPFDIDDLDGERLQAGSTARISGSLAGIGAGFDVDVSRADEHGLQLTADGLIALEVIYELLPTETGTEMSASVSIRRSNGLAGRLLARATGALLAAGALDGAAARVSRAAQTQPLALAA